MVSNVGALFVTEKIYLSILITSTEIYLENYNVTTKAVENIHILTCFLFLAFFLASCFFAADDLPDLANCVTWDSFFYSL